MDVFEVRIKLLEDKNVQLKSKLRDVSTIEVKEPKTKSVNTRSEIETSNITQTENNIEFNISKLECNICHKKNQKYKYFKESWWKVSFYKRAI